MQSQYSSILLVVMTLLAMFNGDYFYRELNGEQFWRTEFNFSVIINEFQGIVFYGVDQYRVYLIKFDESGRDIIYRYQYTTEYQGGVRYRITDLCGCPDCKMKNITFVFPRFANLSETIICNNKKTTIVMQSDFLKADQTHGLPIPKDRKRKILYIWIGNVGPYIGFNNYSYEPYSKQLVGCIDTFYYDNKRIDMNDKGTHFSSCNATFTETICNNEKCQSVKISKKVFNCSFPVLHEGFCEIDSSLSNYTAHNQSFLVMNLYNGPIGIKLKWKQNITRFQCLMEIELRNRITLTFAVNQFGDVLMYRRHIDSSYYMPVSLAKSSANSTSILLVDFLDPRYLITICSRYFVVTYNELFIGQPVSVNIGFSVYKDLCLPFQGMTNFQYNPKLLKAYLKESLFLGQDISKSNTVDKFTHVNIVLLSLVLFSLLINIFLSVSLAYVYVRKKPPSIPNTNLYDEMTDIRNSITNVNRINEPNLNSVEIQDYSI